MNEFEFNNLTNLLLDRANRESGLGGFGSNTFSVLNGFNSIPGVRLPLPPNTDVQGFVFFTRPNLNLSYNNVISIRKFAALTSRDPDSMDNAIRCMLSLKGYDSPVGVGMDQLSTINTKLYGDFYRSKLINDSTPFIPLLSNTLESFTGWPEKQSQISSFVPGTFKEVVSYIDDNPYMYQDFDLIAVFSNMEGDPLTRLFSVWLEYSQHVMTGTMIPFPVYIVSNKLDYTTRPYVLILDRSGKFVQHIGSCGYMFPYTDPTADKFNFSLEEGFNERNNKITISFKAHGAIYDDPILITQFNRITKMMNPQMDESIRNQYMMKVDSDFNLNLTQNDKAFFNFKTYPYIAESYELEWWIEKSIYDEYKTKFFS